jgi:hypothetical protein
MLTLTADANPNSAQRTAGVSLSGQMFTVTQAGAECRFDLSPTSIEIGADGGRRSVQVTAPGGCTWTSASAVSWIEAATSAGSGSGIANFDIDENKGALRTADVHVAGHIVNVTQSNGRPPAHDPPGNPEPPSDVTPPRPSLPEPPGDEEPTPTDPCPPKGGGKECKGGH